jgi:hypothetical protein
VNKFCFVAQLKNLNAEQMVDVLEDGEIEMGVAQFLKVVCI